MVRKIFHTLLIIFCLLTGLYSCSKKIYQSGENNPIIFPSPPDTARIQFLARYSASSDIVGKSKFKTFVAGEEEPLPIIKPYGIAINNSEIFVADAGISGLQIINLKEETFNYFIPGGRGKLGLPINCFWDTGGDLYVTDVGRNQVVVFNSSLSYKGEISGGENFKPVDVYVFGDTILVTDPKNNRINAYDKNSLQLIFSFPEHANVGDENWLYNPLNLWVEGGNIYVTDFGDSRVKIFTRDGRYLSSVGSYGRGLGQFIRPKGIAVDHEQNLYVVDAGFQNVQIFNKEGQLLMFFGGAYQGPGYMYLPANIIIDYDHLEYYEKYIDPAYNLKYLIFVTNQYGPDKVSVYGRIVPKQ